MVPLRKREKILESRANGNRATYNERPGIWCNASSNVLGNPRMSKIFALKWLLLKRREDSLLL